MGMLKYESSMFIQVQTGKIGLRAFLHQKWIPKVSPECSYGAAPKTAFHLATSYKDIVTGRLR